jgi:CRP-like cAMP-binding protein
MSTPAQAPVTAADLRPVDLFDDLDDAELAEWAAPAERRDAEVGDVVLEENSESRGLLLLLEGTVQLFRHDGDRLEPAGHQTAPTWIGAVPALTETPVSVRMVAATPVRSAVIPAAEFRDLALAHPSVHRRIMR